MQVFISGFGTNRHNTIVYNCTINSKVSELRDFIKTQYKYPDNVYILTHCGKTLNNNEKTFQECGLSDQSTIRFNIVNRFDFIY